MNRLLPQLVIACCLPACGSALPMAPPDPATTTSLSAAEFGGTGRIPTGFDARSADQAWQAGDEVVFALRLRRGDTVKRWLLRFRVVLGDRVVQHSDDFVDTTVNVWEEQSWTYSLTEGSTKTHSVKSRMLLVAVRVGDEQGKELASSIVKLPATLLERGMLPAIDCAVALAAGRGSNGGQSLEAAMQPMVEAAIGLMALLDIVQGDDALADYFWQLVEKPSLWSIVTGLGVRATTSMPFELSVPATRLPPGLPSAGRAFVVPLQILVNDRPALSADVIVTDASRPYALCGGMVAAVARHPSQPDVTLEVQLLAARLGSEQAAVEKAGEKDRRSR